MLHFFQLRLKLLCKHFSDFKRNCEGIRLSRLFREEFTTENTVISPNFLRPKLYGNCAFPQNFHTRKLGKITVFYAVISFAEPFSLAFSTNFHSKHLLRESQTWRKDFIIYTSVFYAPSPDLYLETRQTSKIKLFAKIVNLL